MREEAKDPARINHMIHAITNVIKFMEGKTLQDLEVEPILFYGVVKNIEIIGEAAYKISDVTKNSHPEIPWKNMIGMRHVLVHDYYHIRPEEVYKVYLEDIPHLLPLLKNIQI